MSILAESPAGPRWMLECASGTHTLDPANSLAETPLCVFSAGEMVETPHGVLEMPEFGLTEEEKAYRGPPDDRRALMAHRKWLQVPRAAVTQLLAEGAC